MGNLVFQATLGGQVNLVGPNTASTYNINVPAVAGNMVTTGDTGTVTSTMLASSLSLTTPNINVATGTSLKVTSGFYSTSSSSFTYTDGIVMDYTTGLGRISVGTSDGLAFYNAGVATTELMRIDSSGNVGIGTASPVGKFDVQGNINFNTLSTQAGRAATYSIGASDVGTVGQKANISFVGAGTNGFLTNITFSNFSGDFYNATLVERMRIDNSGNLLVGQTSGNNSRLNVYGTGNASYVRGAAIFCTTNAGDANYPGISIQKYDSATSTAQVFIQFISNNGAGGNGQINGNGSGAAAFGSFSDSRLKENIVDLPSQLSNILSLRPVEFDYIEAEGGGHQIGFIAQEMQEIYPDAVGERPDGMLTITGWSKTESRLVKAIQEQQAIIQQLQADVSALKAPQ